MKRVWVSEDPVLVATRERVLDALLARQVPVQMACGGKGLCATCHCYIEDGGEHLSPQTPRETAALAMLANRRPSSRLSCQAKVLGEGVKVRLPQGKYLESTADLEQLIGRRAEASVLHPVTGRVLVEEGKIITRSRIVELARVSAEVAAMKARSESP
jgi:ferredoxin